MIYAQFWQKYNGSLVEAVGSNAVIIIDARLRPSNLKDIAEYHCRKRGYLAWQLHRGESFSNSRPISERTLL